MTPPSPTGFFIGGTCIDICMSIPTHPKQDAKLHTNSQHITIGGCATNASIAFNSLGGNATLAAPFGYGSLRPLLEATLQDHNITLADLTRDKTQNTLYSVILLENEHRTIVYPRAGVPKTPLSPSWSKNLTPPDIILVESYGIDTFMQASDWVLSQNCPIVLDGDGNEEEPELFLQASDIAILSEAYMPGTSLTDIQTHGPQKVAITRGPNSILWKDKDRTGEIPIPSTKVISSLGAGDVFHGAFCYHYALGKSFEESLSCAAQAATQACTYPQIIAWAKDNSHSQ